MFMNILDSIIVPVVVLNGMAIAAIVAIALGTTQDRPRVSFNYLTDATHNLNEYSRRKPTNDTPPKGHDPAVAVAVAVAADKVAADTLSYDGVCNNNSSTYDISLETARRCSDSDSDSDSVALVETAQKLLGIVNAAASVGCTRDIKLHASPILLTTVFGMDVGVTTSLVSRSDGVKMMLLIENAAYKSAPDRHHYVYSTAVSNLLFAIVMCCVRDVVDALGGVQLGDVETARFSRSNNSVWANNSVHEMLKSKTMIEMSHPIVDLDTAKWALRVLGAIAVVRDCVVVRTVDIDAQNLSTYLFLGFSDNGQPEMVGGTVVDLEIPSTATVPTSTATAARSMDSDSDSEGDSDSEDEDDDGEDAGLGPSSPTEPLSADAAATLAAAPAATVAAAPAATVAAAPTTPARVQTPETLFKELGKALNLNIPALMASVQYDPATSTCIYDVPSSIKSHDGAKDAAVFPSGKDGAVTRFYLERPPVLPLLDPHDDHDSIGPERTKHSPGTSEGNEEHAADLQNTEQRPSAGTTDNEPEADLQRTKDPENPSPGATTDIEPKLLTISQWIDELKDKKDIVMRPYEITDENAIVYVIGDLEGHAQLLVNTLIDCKIVEVVGKTKDTLKWVAADNVYVVQCGDQIDPLDRWKDADSGIDQTPKLDLQALLLTSYLSKISNGKMVNIIGNHEWNQVVQWMDFDLCTALGCSRSKLFEFDQVMGKIIRERHVAFKINDVLFSHAGVTAELIHGVAEIAGINASDMSVSQMMRALNTFVTDRSNWGHDADSKDEVSAMYKYVYHRTDRGGDSITGNRKYDTQEYRNTDGTTYAYDGGKFTNRAFVPKHLANQQVRVQVIGHNKWPTMFYFVKHDSSDVEEKLEILDGDTLNINTHTDLCMVGTDTQWPTHTKKLVMHYLVMNFGKDKNVDMVFRTFECPDACLFSDCMDACVKFNFGDLVAEKQIEKQTVDIDL